MAEVTTLARPYAKAAFDFANDAGNAGKVAQWQEYLIFSASLMKDEAFNQYIRQPSMTQSDKLDALVKISNDSFPTDYKNFLAQLAENDRLALLPAIADEFDVLKSQAQQELKAEVESAFELSPAEIALLEAGLEKRFGQKVQLTSSVNAELIAGVVIRVGDQIIDDSALAKLKQLKTKLTA